jgi:hypothetical protein
MIIRSVTRAYQSQQLLTLYLDNKLVERYRVMNSVAMPLHIYVCIRSIQRGSLTGTSSCLFVCGITHVCLAGMGRALRPTRRAERRRRSSLDSHSGSLGASIEGEGQYAAVLLLGPRQAGWARWGERGAGRSVRVSFPAGGGGRMGLAPRSPDSELPGPLAG